MHKIHDKILQKHIQFVDLPWNGGENQMNNNNKSKQNWQQQ